MKKYKKGIESEGFTIIEVMIVLAIAGLILLTVFLAVPALQRNNRNTDRKEDAGHLNTAIESFISNNNSNVPGYGTTFPAAASDVSGSSWAADCATIINSAGTLSVLKDIPTSDCEANSTKYNGSNVWPATASVGLANYGFSEVYEETGDPSPVTGDNQQANDGLVYDVGTVCSGSGATTTGASTNNSTLLYTIESGSNSYTWSCIQVQ